MKKTLIILVFLFSTSISSLIWGADFQKGLDAAIKGDYATALEEWMPLAKGGNPDAQFNIGLMYFKGRGVPQDYQETMRWYRLAAEQGFAQAQYNLGVMYVKGEGVPKDYKEAERWYRLAAEQGYKQAQYLLGMLYETGDEGIPQDDLEAVKWYQSAAEQGHAQAQFNFGLMYFQGQGVPKDYKEAFKWFRLSAEQAHPPALVMVGGAYLEGAGVKKDLIIAYMWFNIAAMHGEETATSKVIGEIKENLTIIELGNAQTMIEICVRNNFKNCDQSNKPDDSLVGESIICGDIDENQNIIMLGIEFLEDNKVEMYNHDLNAVSEDFITSLFYQTSFSLIKVFNENKPGFLQIDRETLNVTIHDEAVDDEYLFNGENCLVYNNETIRTNMIKMKQKLIDERSKDN